MTVTNPVAPAPTVAVILVAEFTTNDEAAVPPKRTIVAPLKLVPVMLMEVPVGPEFGVNEVTVGAGCTYVKLVGDIAVPPGVLYTMGPVEPAATTAVSVVEFTRTNEVTCVPPIVTGPNVDVKLVPLIVTVVPVVPVVGVNEVIVGIG